jgi:hypothetical protein
MSISSFGLPFIAILCLPFRWINLNEPKNHNHANKGGSPNLKAKGMTAGLPVEGMDGVEIQQRMLRRAV